MGKSIVPTREVLQVAGRGFAPTKDPSKLRKPSKAAAQPKTKVSTDGRMRGPALPKGVTPDGEPWHTRTVAWWVTWRKSPQALIFIDTDWDFLLDTALMHHMMWSKGRWDFAAELRLRVSKFGATIEDRNRLRLDIETPPKRATAAAGGNVTDISSRRKRLLA